MNAQTAFEEITGYLDGAAAEYARGFDASQRNEYYCRLQNGETPLKLSEEIRDEYRSLPGDPYS